MITDPFPGGLLPRTANQKERDMSETNTEVVHDARHLPDDVGVLQDKVVELTTELVMYRKLASASTEEEAHLFMQEVHFLAVLAAAGFSGDDVKDVVVPAAFQRKESRPPETMPEWQARDLKDKIFGGTT